MRNLHCNAVHTGTGRLCQLPYHHAADGLPLCQNGDIRWAFGGGYTGGVPQPVPDPDVDHGPMPSRQCDEGTCDCADYTAPPVKPAIEPWPDPVRWFKPEDVVIVKNTTGEILAYGVEL